MSEYTTKDDIISDNGILLLSKNHKVDDGILDKLERLGAPISIDSINSEIYSTVRFKSHSNVREVATDEIIKSFAQRKDVFNTRILKKPNKVLRNIIFESQNERWWLYINALSNYIYWLYTHSIDVSMMSMIIAVEAGYKDEQLLYIGLGALLHDIGMLLLPRPIVEKSEYLTEKEQHIFFRHCELGMSSIEPCRLPKECTDIILQHHERLDGSGFPKRLSGDEISLSSRIVMIADTVDLLTSKYPGRKNIYQFNEAIELIKSDKKFPYEVIHLFEKALK